MHLEVPSQLRLASKDGEVGMHRSMTVGRSQSLGPGRPGKAEDPPSISHLRGLSEYHARDLHHDTHTALSACSGPSLPLMRAASRDMTYLIPDPVTAPWKDSIAAHIPRSQGTQLEGEQLCKNAARKSLQGPVAIGPHQSRRAWKRASIINSMQLKGKHFKHVVSLEVS